MATRPRKNFGERPKGWKAVTVDIPEGLAAAVKSRRETLPTASWKLMGTAAIGAFMAMPEETQEALYRWAHSHELEPDKLDFQQARSIMLAMVHTVGAGDLPPTESAPKAGSEQGGKRGAR